MAKLIAAMIVGIMFILMIAAFSALTGFIFQLLFNYVAPVFWTTAPVLTFYQAWAVTFLFSFVVGFFKRK